MAMDIDIDYMARSIPHQCSTMSDEVSDDPPDEIMETELGVSLKLDQMKVFDLSTQFATICAQVEISEEELQVISDLMERIRKTAEARNPRANLTTLFRHNYLGLRNAGSNQLLVYLSEAQYRPLIMNRNEVENLFKGSQLKILPLKRPLEVEAGYPFMDVKSGLLVGIATHSDHQAEVVTCQLAKYLLRFDPKAKSVLALVQYWARENKITLSSKQKLRSDTSSIPDPAALEWLILFFLGQEKVIPTLQKMRNRTKQRKNLVIEGRPQFNVSFSYDRNFEDEWKAVRNRRAPVPAPGSNQYVLEVFQLVHDFFQFCSRNDLKGKVLNTITSEIIPVLTAIEEGLIEPSLNVSKCKDKVSFELMRKKALFLEAELEEEIYLLQPFYHLRFEICQKKFRTQICPLMEKTVKKLQFFLKNPQITKNGTIFQIDLKSLFQCDAGKELIYGKLKTHEDQDNLDLRASPNMIILENIGIDEYEPESFMKSEEVHDLQLSAQFAGIRREVEIPEEECQQVTNLLRRIKEVVKRQVNGDVQLNLFRHYYLKLRNAGSNHLSIFMSLPSYKPLLFNSQKVQMLVHGSSLKSLGLHGWGKDVELGIPFLDTESGLKFELETQSAQVAEVVSCKLVRYLLKFDPRVKSLLTLVHFWARANGVTLSDKNTPRNKQELNIPDPAALEWLCLFYLMKEKIIPSLRELKTPYKDRVQYVDYVAFPNFPKDLYFLRDWQAAKLTKMPEEGSNAYVLELLELALGFFSFYGRSDLKGKVLNTKRGEVVPLRNAIEEGHLIHSINTNNCVGHRLDKIAESKAREIEKKFKGEIYLMQPFLYRRFEFHQRKFDYQVRPLMEQTARKLEAYLEFTQKPKDGEIFEVVLKSLFQCKTGEDGPRYERLKAIKDIGGLEKLNIEAVEEYQLPQHLVSVQDSSQVPGKHTSLLSLFNTVQKEVEIGDEEFNQFLNTIGDLMASQGLTGCTAVMFRHFSGSEASIVVFCDHPETGTRSVKVKPTSPGPSQVHQLSFGQLILHIADRSFLPELQACRMVEYYCTFDPRVKSLMSTVFYWAHVNNILLGEDDPLKLTVGIAPDPALLEWLVIFFLCQKKMVPPPCEIIERNGDEDLFDAINIGVKRDPEYAREWWNRYKETDEEQHIYNVFVLVQEFFHFWSQFRFQAMMDPIIIDLKNGRYFEKEEVIKNSENIRRLSWATGISQEDLELLDSEPKMREGFYSKDEVVTIIHPLYIKYGFSFSWKSFLLSVCPKMGVTAGILKKMLEDYMSGDVETDLM